MTTIGRFKLLSYWLLCPEPSQGVTQTDVAITLTTHVNSGRADPEISIRAIINKMMLLALLLLFIWNSALSQIIVEPPANMGSRHFYMKDGLPDEVVTSIVRDDHGFLWLGTHSGLARFDGYSFTAFRNDPYSSKSLTNNRINSLYMDEAKRLWIGHSEGIDVFDLETQNFPFRWYDSALHEKGLNTSVIKFCKGKNNRIWILTNAGIYIGNSNLLSIEKDPQFSQDLDYRDLTESEDGNLWVGTTEKLLNINIASQRITSYLHDPTDTTSLSSSFIQSLYLDKTGRLWVGTQQGLNLLNPDRASFKRFPSKYNITTFIEHDDGTLWLGSDWGLHEFNPTSGTYRRIANIFSFTFSTLKDPQGIVWIGSHQGLHQYYPKLKNFNTYNHFNNNIGHLVEDNRQTIWMATFAGLFQFDDSFNKVQKHKDTRYPDMITSLFPDRRGNIWFTYGQLLEVYDIENKKSKQFKIPELVQPYALLVDSQGGIWIGNREHIAKYDTASKIYAPQIHFPKTAANHFLEDRNQNIWIATNTGLLRYNLHQDKLDIFKNDTEDRHTLSNNVVHHLLLDEKNVLWVATDGGLNRIIPGTENTTPKFQHWHTSNSGIANENVYCVLGGKDGTLWMANGDQISHFDPSRNHFRNYTYHNESKLPSASPGGDFKQGAYSGRGLISSNGQIYFGTNRGLVVFHPDSLQDNKYVPPVVITGLSIHNHPAPIKGTNSDTLEWKSPLTKSISYADKIMLHHDQNILSFSFAALNYIKPEDNLYKYKLEPLQKHWVSSRASNRVAQYTNLSPGTYTFHVLGSNNDKIWNETGTSIVIIIMPPWWQTWWAYSFYILTFLALIIVWRHYDIKRVKLKHHAEHLSELDQLKSRFFTNISHEFRTPITLILGPLRDLYNGNLKDDPKSVLKTVIRNGERLHRLINQLLDLSKLEAGKLRLHATPVNVVEYLREIAASYESQASDKKIKYIFYPEVQELTVYIDQEKIEKIVHNLLSNAFKFTKAGGEIVLNLKADLEQCVIIVKDSGIGIPSDQIDKIFDRFYQVDSSQTRGYEGSGLGMALAKELVDLHRGKISVKSIEGTGSIFTVTLPLGKNHLRNDEISDETRYHFERASLSETMIQPMDCEKTLETRPPPPSQQPVILIVEDNPDMRAYLRKTFSEQFQILEAENGKEGVKFAEETIPDLIISDIMMPEMDGYKLCELMKSNELTSHIPVFLLTAKADRESKLSGLNTGADDYISKPFDADELRLIVRNRIEERRRMRERFSREITLEPRQIAITSQDEKFLTKVLAIIEAHMDDENFSIDELSREAGFSNMHFYRKIKALSGQMPSQFLRTIRLKRAAELLSHNHDNVTQIAYSVGFGSLSYFNKCFKEQFGMTPGKYSEERASY